MKQLLRSSLSTVLYRGSAFLASKTGGTRILCYHRVNDQVPGYLSVPVEHFREQMKFLAEEGYRTISLGELLTPPPQTTPLSKKSIVITFDDGFGDNYENAFSVLEEVGFKASIFCIARKVGEPGYLDKLQILEMRDAGFEFGSHTLSHPRLPEISTEQKWWEIFGSKRFLEELLGFKSDFFCYPYGEYDWQSVRMVQQAGYRGACSNRPGANRNTDPHLLKRTEIGGFDSLYDFQKKVAGAYDLLHQGLHWVRRKP